MNCTDGFCGAIDCKRCHPFGEADEGEDELTEDYCSYPDCLNAPTTQCHCCKDWYCEEHLNKDNECMECTGDEYE